MPSSPTQPTTPASHHDAVKVDQVAKSKKKHHTKKAVKTAKPANKYNNNFGIKGENGAAHHSSSKNSNPLAEGLSSNSSTRPLVATVKAASANKADQNKATLPQTGEKENFFSLLGLGLASLAALLGLADRKRKN